MSKGDERGISLLRQPHPLRTLQVTSLFINAFVKNIDARIRHHRIRKQAINYLKLILIAVAGLYGAYCSRLPYEYGFIDGVDTLFHEAGHPLFGFFGSDFLMVLGGTLMQLIMPGIVILYFFFTRQKFSGAVSGVWLSQNLFNIANYANDAMLMELPLVGNGDRVHDWNYMLTEFGMLNKDYLISLAIHRAGVIMLVVSVAAGVYFSRAKFDSPST